jgi:nucleoside-diphosphate-sugar epimerase
MKLLIAGSSGSLGTAVTKEALRNNINVYVINRGNRAEFIPEEVHFLKADIRDKQYIMRLLDGLRFDCVIDFICHHPEQIEYSFNLFKSITEQYILISSVIVYNVFVNNNLCEENASRVISTWKASVEKNLCEETLIRLASEYNVNYTIIRPATNYGDTRLPTWAIGGQRLFFIDRIINGKPIVVWNNGENRYNVLHVNDFAVGVVGIIGNKWAYNEIFNIAGDEIPSRKEIIDTLNELVNVGGDNCRTINIPVEFLAKEMPQGVESERLLCWDNISSSFSSQKIKTLHKKFKQNITLKEGLRLTLHYYKNRKNVESGDYQWDGIYDRVIAKYVRRNNITTKDMKLNFIDYLNEKNPGDRFTYFMYRHFHPDLVPLLLLPIRIVKKLLVLF